MSELPGVVVIIPALVAEMPLSDQSRCTGRSKISRALRGIILAAWFILAVTQCYALKKPE